MKFPKLTELNRISPGLVRALAWHKGRLLSYSEIAHQAGISRDRSIRLSRLPNWDNISIGEAFRYVQACGFDFCSLRTGVYRRIRSNKGNQAIKRMTVRQRRMYLRLVNLGC